VFAIRVLCQTKTLLYAKLLGHRYEVNIVSFNLSGELLVSNLGDCDIRMWNWASKEGILIHHFGHRIKVLQA